MRFFRSVCTAVAGLCANIAPAAASVVISNFATENMACSGGVCAPTAADAVLNVQDLEAMLASGNATVTTTGSGVQATDIRVNARLTWSVATKLSLDAYHSIEVNSKVTVAGTGGVSLTTNDGGSGNDFACNSNGALTFSNLSSTLTINGTVYTLVNSVASLASVIAAAPSGAYALAKSYNAKKDGTYTSSPISTVFGGSFNGLGNTISNLSINDPSDTEVGLFAETNGSSTISNIHLLNERVQGGPGSWVGGLAGRAGGVVAHSSTSGVVSGSEIVGGLVGESGIVVTDSGSTAAVSGGASTGGLIGSMGYSGTIIDSWATGNVSRFVAAAGGLAGINNGSDIKRAWASGQVGIGTSRAGAFAGGLIGYEAKGSIERSHASGAVTCLVACGGLLGYYNGDGSGKISESYATGAVTSLSTITWEPVGGLVGDSSICEACEIMDSYATGAVSGGTTGGLVGQNGMDRNSPYHTISTSYATGAVNGTSAGGLIGSDHGGYIKRAYWDTTTSGITNRSQGAGYPANDPGIKGLPDKKLESGLPPGFDPKIWSEDSTINGGLPYLINNPPPK